ncbi:siroheme decarboxylase subunit beta [Arhodomonas sp. AD133]|uniref:siroheme decarboxylase subunit beta n=1 Tax=Arhodomonas sp. AD133 TaxID=3415009 RepID=UPI003EC07712
MGGEIDGLSAHARAVLASYQNGLPLSPRPFREMARHLGTTETGVLEALRELIGRGVASRVGPVFRPGTVGASTLAAMAVPSARLDAVAAKVSALPAVNHNYEREHRFNLWFVATGPDRTAVAKALAGVRAQTGLPVLDLPMLEAYHIDLGFPVDGVDASRPAAQPPIPVYRPGPGEGALVAAVQGGLPLVPRPFARLAAGAALTEDRVLATLRRWQAHGVLARFGVVVRHRELGYRANAMVVWDVPDTEVAEVGRAFAGHPFVTLCYRRPRRLPEWPYNLFCMIHGRSRERVTSQARVLATVAGDAARGHDLLFSRRCFKQRGARYRFPEAVAHGAA